MWDRQTDRRTDTLIALLDTPLGDKGASEVWLAAWPWRQRSSYERSHSTMSRYWAGTPFRYVTKPTRSTRPCIPPGSPNRILASIGWGKDGKVTYAVWQASIHSVIPYYAVWLVANCYNQSINQSISLYVDTKRHKNCKNNNAKRCRTVQKGTIVITTAHFYTITLTG